MDFDYLTDSSKAVGGDPPAVSDSDTREPFDYLTDSSKAGVSAGEYATRAQKAGVAVGRTPEEHADILRRRGFSEPAVQQMLQPYQLGLAKRERDVSGVTNWELFKRHGLSFGEVWDQNDYRGYHEATQRLKEGKASGDDFARIAKFEALAENDRLAQQTLGGSLAMSALEGGKILGEFYAGGKVAGAIGRGFGLGASAEAVAAARAAGAPAAQVSAGAQLANHFGRMALVTPAVPALWLNQAKERNLAEHRDPINWRGFPEALGVAYANALVLGSLQSVAGGVPTVAGRVAAKGAIGIGEQQGADLALGLADELVGTNFTDAAHRFGLLGKIGRGEYGEAGKDAIVQMFTFSMFAGLHELGRRGSAGAEPFVFGSDLTEAGLDAAREAMHAPTEAFGAAVGEMTRTGLSTRHALESVKSVQELLLGRIKEAADRGETLTRAEGRARFDSLPDGKLKDYAMGLADLMPEKAPERPAAGAGVRVGWGMEGSYDRLRNAGVAPPEAFGKATEGLADVRPGVYPVKPGEKPVPEATRPAAAPPVAEVLSEDAIRAVARKVAFKSTGKIETVLATLNKSPVGRALLAAARAKAAETAGKPPQGPPSPAEPKPAPGSPEAPKATAVTPRPLRGTRLGEPRPGGSDPAGNRLTVHPLLDAGGNEVGDARVFQSGQTLHVHWIGLSGKGGGEGRGVAGNALGPRELLRLLPQLAAAYPEAVVAKYTPAAGRLKAGETKWIDLTKYRPAEKPVAEKVVPAESNESGSVLGASPEQLAKSYESAPEPVKVRVVSKRKPGETDATYANRLKREGGVQTLRDEVSRRGGIDEDTAPTEILHLKEEELGSIFRGSGGKKGTNTFDEMAQELVRSGDIQEQGDENPSETLKRHLLAGKEVGDEGDYHEQQLQRDAENQQAFAEAKAAYEKEIADARAEATGAREGDAGIAEVVDEGVHLADQVSRAGEEAEARGSAAGGAEARPGGTAAERGTDLELTREDLRGVLLSLEDAGQWHDLPQLLRDEIATAFPKFAEAAERNAKLAIARFQERHQGGHKTRADEVPIDSESERVVDESRYNASIKAGIKAMLAGATVRSEELAKASGGYAGEHIRKKAIELFGESPWVRLEEEARQRGLARLDRQRSETNTEDVGEGRPSILSGPGGVTSAGAGEPGAGEPAGRAPSPAELIARDRARHGVPAYREGVKGAAYHTGPGAVVTGTMDAQNAALAFHEVAHHVAATNHFPFEGLPEDVRRGFESLNYDKTLAGRAALEEGFAEWYRRRQTDKLGKLSADERAAAWYAETWAKVRGLEKKFDQAREEWRRYAALPSPARAAAHLSPTGKRVGATGKAGVIPVLKEAVDDDLAVLSELEGAAEVKSEPGEDARTVAARVFFANKQTAREFEENGIHTYVDGKKTVIGKPLKDVIGVDDPNFKPQYVTPYDPETAPNWVKRILGSSAKLDKGSPADVFLVAHHAIDEKGRGRQFFPDDQQELLEAGYDELLKDEQFKKWALPMAVRYTETMNAGGRALAAKDIHYLSPSHVQYLEEKRPTYVPTTRVKEEFDTQQAQVVSTGGRGATYSKPRTGSGEQIVAPLVSLKRRYQTVAALMNRQRFLNALAAYAERGGTGAYILAGAEKVTAAGAKVAKSLLEDLSGDAEAALAELRAMGGESYFTYAPWPRDGTKPTLNWHGPGGEPTNLRVGDERLYNLATGQQVDANQFAKIVAGIANVEVLGTKPVKAMTGVVKGLAVTASVGFQFRNVVRDIYTFLANSIRRGSVTELASAYKRMYAAEWAVLRGEVPKDEVARYFLEAGGRNQKMLGFDQTQPGSVYEQYGTPRRGVIPFARNKWAVVKQFLNVLGAGENAPRFLEWKNKMAERGWPEEKIAEALKQARAEAEGGLPYQDPVEESLKDDAMMAAAEVTTPFNRQGVLTRQLNQIHPFFGPAVSGMSKAIRNWKTNAKGASIAMGLYLGTRVLHWLYNRDQDWYKELESHDRYANFVVDIPGLGLRRIPAPRDLEVPVGALTLSVLDAATDRNPDVLGALRESWGAVAPPLPVTPLGQVAIDLARNKQNTLGGPVVPRGEEHASAMDQFLKYQAPYAAEQLLGGRGSVGGVGRAFVPFSEVHNARRSVTEFYGRWEELQAGHERATRQGARYEGEAEYARFERAAGELRELNHEARGERKVGGQWVRGEEPTAERREEIRKRQVEIARRALGAE